MTLLYFNHPLHHTTIEVLDKLVINNGRSCYCLFNSRHLSDVVFVVGKYDDTSQEIFGHKAIIELASDPLKANFQNHWKDCDRIRITDFDPSPFWSLLRFIYKGDLVIEPTHLLDTIELARMYLVDSFFDCLMTTDNIMEMTNVVPFLTLLRIVPDKYKIACFKALVSEESCGGPIPSMSPYIPKK